MTNDHERTNFTGIFQDDLEQELQQNGPINKIPMKELKKILAASSLKIEDNKIARIKQRLEFLFWSFSNWQKRENERKTKAETNTELNKIAKKMHTLGRVIEDSSASQRAITKMAHRAILQNKKNNQAGTEHNLFPSGVLNFLENLEETLLNPAKHNDGNSDPYDTRSIGRSRKDLNIYLMAFWKIELGQDVKISVHENNRQIPPSKDMQSSDFVRFVCACHAYLDISHSTGGALKTALLDAKKGDHWEEQFLLNHLYAPIDWR